MKPFITKSYNPDANITAYKMGDNLCIYKTLYPDGIGFNLYHCFDDDVFSGVGIDLTIEEVFLLLVLLFVALFSKPDIYTE